MSSKGTGRSLVIVPTYNELESLPIVVERLFAATPEGVDLLVVDDSSPDGTARWVEEAGRGDPRVNLIERAGKGGLGTAYVTGFRWALERDYQAVVEMDADLSHDPADVPRLLGALADADLVIGSRYVPGGTIVNWSGVRRVLSRWGNIYARLWLGFGVHDSTSGFRAFRGEMLGRLKLDALRSHGYSFQVEMVRRTYAAGGRMTEVPIVFTERTHGRSKMSKRIVAEALFLVTAGGIKDRLARLNR